MSYNNEQKKAIDRQIIRDIFENIINNLQQNPIPANKTATYNYQIGILNLYKDALINEVNACKTTSDHPLRLFRNIYRKRKKQRSL